jgi:hypothetical protein
MRDFRFASPIPISQVDQPASLGKVLAGFGPRCFVSNGGRAAPSDTQPTSASAAAWRRFIDVELADLRAPDKWTLNGCSPFAIARHLDAEHAADVLKGEYLERNSCMGWPAILDWTG